MTGLAERGDSLAGSAAEQAAIPILVFGADAGLVWINGQAEEWLGASRRALARTRSWRRAAGAGLCDFVDQAVRDRRSLVSLAVELGPDRLFDLHGRWSEKLDQLTVSILPHARSIPLASEAAALGFGRMLAHELKNPLASARGAAQLIQRASDLETTTEFAGMIIEDIDRITRLADHWSGVGDITLGPVGLVSLNEIAVAAVDSVLRASPASTGRIEQQFDPSLPDAAGDRDLLHQTVLNLLQNALDATAGHEAPSIVISTRYDTGPRSRQGHVPAPLLLCVSDNGGGIPEALGTQIFAPFVTTKPAGEGLGLAFCARIIALHHGQLDYARDGGRTSFNLRLPLTGRG